MKKIIALLTVIAIALSFTACGNIPNDAADKIITSAKEQIEKNNETGKKVNELSGEILEEIEESLDNQDELSDKVFDKIEENLDKQEEVSEKIDKFVDGFVADKEVEGFEPQNQVKDGPTNTFYNDSVDGRWTVNAISVFPKAAEFKDGKLIVTCFVVNGYNTTASSVHIKTLTVSGKDGKLYADGSFAAQNLSIAPMSYVEHTFTFSGDAVHNYGADLSFLNVKYSTHAVH